jgi:hypothetical protein
MSSRAQHYREAERLLTLEEAQVHAMLATVHDDAYSEYLDLKSMEEMRERVGRDARRDVT